MEFEYQNVKASIKFHVRLPILYVKKVEKFEANGGKRQFCFV